MNKTYISILFCIFLLLMVGVADAGVDSVFEGYVDTVTITSGDKLSTVDDVTVSAHFKGTWGFGWADVAEKEETSENHMNFFWEIDVCKKSLLPDPKIGSKKVYVEYYKITDSPDGYKYDFRLREEDKDWTEWEEVPVEPLRSINNIPIDINLGTGNYNIYAEVRVRSNDTWPDTYSDWKESATSSIQIIPPPHLSHWPSEPVSGSSSTVKVNQIVEIPFVAYNDGGPGGESYVTVLTDSPYLEITERCGYPGSCTKIYKPSDPVHYKDGRYQAFDGWLADAYRTLKQNSYIGFSKVKFKPTRAGTYHIYWRAAFDTPANGCYFIRFPSSGAVDPLGYTARYITIEVTDNVKPSIAITHPTTGQEFETSTITVTGTASDNSAVSKVEVKVGSSGSWHTASGTKSWKKSVTLSSGSNTIYARTTDTSGNTKEASVTVTYNPPPTITITEPTDGQTFTTDTITVSGTASDNYDVSKVEVKVGSGDWQDASGTKTWSMSVILAPGENTIYAKATDTSSKTKEASVTATYTLPDFPPTITITEPTDGRTFTTNTITVSGTASDNDAVSKVEVKVGSGSWREATGTKTWSMSVTLALGENMIYAKATDTSSKTKEASVTVTYTTADPPQTITITEPTNGQTFITDTITVSGTTSDNYDVSKVEVKVGSGSWREATGTKTWSMSVILAPGENTIYARATDTSDKTKEASVTVTYTPRQGPKLGTSPDPPSHDFSTVPKGQEKSWNFEITNCGSDTLTWSVSCDQPWIKVNPTSDWTTEETDRVTITIDTHGLSEGKTYTGQITIDSNGGRKTGTITVNVPGHSHEPKLGTSPDPPSHDFGTVPKGQTRTWNFDVTNCGSDTVLWSIISLDPSWLSGDVIPESTTTETDTATITIDTSKLSYGKQEGHFLIVSNGGSKTGTITVEVVPPTESEPKLCTSSDPPSTNFGTVPEDQKRTWDFFITNSGSGTLTWAITCDQPSWLNVNPVNGSTTTLDVVTVTIDTHDLTPGTHTGHITITSNGGRKTGMITVTVPPLTQEPKLCTSPDPPSTNFGTVEKDQTRTWDFFITNCGSGTLTWAITCNQPSWLNVNPASGSTTALDVVTVTIDTHDLTPGTHTGHITLTSNGGEKTGTITVNVPPPAQEPKLCTSPDPPTTNFGTVAKDQTRTWDFFITNCGSGTLTWAITCDQPSWLNVNRVMGSTTALDVVTVTIDTHDLSPGTHTGHITLTSNGGEKTGTITVNVPEQIRPNLCTSPDPPSHDFGTVAKDQTRTWDFDIRNCGSGTLTWSVSDDKNWMSVYPTSGSTTTETDKVTVRIDTQGLSPGTHTGHITLTSNGGSKTGTITVVVPKPKPQNQPPENPTLTPDRSSPQLAGTTIKWTASATDPDGDPLYYQFRLKGPATGNSWTVKRDWSTARTWTWYTTASDVGESDISVRIRDGHHAQASSYDLKKTVYNYKTADKKRPTATIDSITPNPATQGDDTVRFKGHGYDSDGYIVDYYWKSSKDGKLSSSKEFPKSASNLDVGTHTISFKVKDNDGQWSDWATATLKIEAITRKPDLIVSSMKFNPNPASAGNDVVVSVTVKNRGSGDAGAHDEFLGQPYATVIHKEWHCSGLKAGASKTFTHTLKNVQKSVTYEACADIGGVVAESDDDNNCRTAYLEVKEQSKYVKFRGLVTGTGGIIGYSYWYVNVDEWISGSLSCDEIYVIQESRYPWGSVDPDISKGDRVEIYGNVNPGGDDECSVGLNGENYYIKKV